MNNIIYVFIGGGVGSVLRYLLGNIIDRSHKYVFPYATLTVNVAACFILGLLSGYLLQSKGDHDAQRLLLGVGLCGGFSTFSTFTAELFTSVRNGDMFTAILYMSVSIVSCLLAFWLAWLICKPS